MNVYEQVYNNIINELYKMMMCDDIIKQIKSNSKLVSLKFLLDFDYDKRNEWIDKALSDYQSLEIFKGTEGFAPVIQCLLVKMYRKLLQKKRKAGDKNPVVTEEEICACIAELKNL